MPIKEFELPPGYCICRKGGRPKKDSRNVAIFLAKSVRIRQHKESVKQADAWILQQWVKEAGISEEAHIRRAFRAANAILSGHLFEFDKTGAIAMQNPIRKGSFGWGWSEGMPEAVPIVIKTLKQVHTVVPHMTPVAVAARCFRT